jgi:hypothetical protein
MRGGKRKKLTKWWATMYVFAERQSFCDGKHQRAKWNPVKQGSALQFFHSRESSLPTFTL